MREPLWKFYYGRTDGQQEYFSLLVEENVVVGRPTEEAVVKEERTQRKSIEEITG